jgi:multidrug resistance protein
LKQKRLIIIFMTVFIDLVGFGIIIPMNPYLAGKFGATPLQVGLLMSVYSLFQFIFAPIWGQLSDRYGRRPVILVSLLGSALAHTGFAFAASFYGLVFARAFAGLFGGNISAAMAYIADITAEKDRSKGMGMIGAAFGLGFICGPVLGGVFGQMQTPFGESFPALIAGGICFLNFLSALKFLPESRKPGSAAAKRGVRFRRIYEALGKPVVGGLILLVFLNVFAMSHIEPSLFLFVQERFGWSQAHASFGFAYIGVIMVFTQGYLIRKMLPKYGEKRLLVAGLALSTSAYALISVSGTLGLLALAVTLLGLGNGLVNPSLNGSISLSSGEHEQGANLGVSQSLSSLARILGPPTGGALFQYYGTWTPFAAAAVICLAALAFAWSMRARIPERGRA